MNRMQPKSINLTSVKIRPVTFLAMALTVFAGPVSAQSSDETQRLEYLQQQNREVWMEIPDSNSAKSASVDEYVTALNSLMNLDDGPAAVATVMQFDAPLTLEARASLEDAGINIEDYLGGTTYLVSSMTSGDMSLFSRTIKDLGASSAVLAASDKVSLAALTPRKDPPVLEEEVEAARPSLSVEFLSVIEEQVAVDSLNSLGVEIVNQLDTHTYEVLNGDVPPSAIAELLIVKSVDIGPVPFYPLNATARRIAETDQAQLFTVGSSTPVYGGVSGDGIRIGIADSGVDHQHTDFNQILPNGSAGPSRVYANRPGSGGHGTHVASIAAGNGFNSQANGLPSFSLRGQAPEAQIGDYASMGSSVARHHEAIVADDTHVTNHSYVQSMDGYGSEARIIDRVVRGDAVHGGVSIPNHPQVWAAGNNGIGSQYGDEEGYFALFTSAKNTISVGSIDTMDGRVSDFSSLGPTFDGRIKPDVMAPGCIDSINDDRIQAAFNNTQGYIGKCGTSMAAPVVAGIIGLMMEGYQDATGNSPRLNSATFKAILVQTARDMIKTSDFAFREFNNPDTMSPLRYYAGPDFATGYGLVDADASIRKIRSSDQWIEASVGQTGEVDRYCMNVIAGSGEVKATLAWDDEPGSNLTASTAVKLINDLDLELVSPSTQTTLPWTLDPLPMTSNPGDGAQDPISNTDVVPARRDVDRRNNVEMANLALPEAGIWQVRVRAFNLPNARAQDYTLVTSQDMVSCPPWL